MTVRDLINQVNALREHTFTEAQLLDWLNEVEGVIMTDVLLWPVSKCLSYQPRGSETVSVCFPDAATMALSEDIGLKPDCTVKLSGLSAYGANNGTTARRVLAVTDNGLTIRFAAGSFAATGETKEAGTLQHDDGDCPLLVLPPHDKLYRPYLLAQIAFAQEEFAVYQNACALFNAYLGEYKRWFSRNYRPADDRRRCRA